MILGVDIGGSGIKGAIVNTEKGTLETERFRIPTPKPSTPKSVAKTFSELVDHFDWAGKVVGCGFPAIIKDGISLSASNIHEDWKGTNVEKVFTKATGCKTFVSNDADVAGLAEINFGVGKNQKGTVLLITIGTGLGSALFINGQLVPNTEFGHLYLRNQKKIAEKYAADSVRKKDGLEWDEWGKRFNEYLNHLEFLFSPDLFILGGGGSKKFDQFEQYLDLKTEVKPAVLRNNAGIIGAAIYGYKKALDLESKASPIV